MGHDGIREPGSDGVTAFVNAARFVAIEGRDKNVQRRISEKLSLALQTRNVAFLIGAGASYYLKAPQIRNMSPSDLSELASSHGQALSRAETEVISRLMGGAATIDLEHLLAELSTAIRYTSSAYANVGSNRADERRLLTDVRAKLNRALALACDLGNAGDASSLLRPHNVFFSRALSSRRADLSRLRVFTTNYDLAIERSLDVLGIEYIDGFAGTIDRTLRMDVYSREVYTVAASTSERRPRRLQDFLYLYKVHGSLNWRSRPGVGDNETRVAQEASYNTTPVDDLALIYPTPQKESETLGYPYSDLLRAFGAVLAEPDSALLVIGYGFSDEHINRIIVQSLAANQTLAIFIVAPFDLMIQVDSSPALNTESSIGKFVSSRPDARISAIAGSASAFERFGETFFRASQLDLLDQEEKP